MPTCTFHIRSHAGIECSNSKVVQNEYNCLSYISILLIVVVPPLGTQYTVILKEY